MTRFCNSLDMNVILMDQNLDALNEVCTSLDRDEHPTRTTSHLIDVSSISEWQTLAPQIRAIYPEGIDLLVLNAGASPRPAEGKSPWQDAEYFQKTLAINTLGYTNGLATFLDDVLNVHPRVQEGSEDEEGYESVSSPPARAIVLTGSKQGITNPPGNPAYNASKAAVRTIAEHLSYDLATKAPNVSVHLLVPGWTYTGLTAGASTEKPAGAWTPEQVQEFLCKKMAVGAFYVICPDNDVSEDLDKKRILWGANDLVQGRPPLTRWRQEWKERAQKEIENTQL